MKKNIPILIAGIVMALTTLLHLTGGQYDHVVPLLASNLEPTDKVVLLGVWHMVSVTLMLMAYWLLKYGLKPIANQTSAMRLMAWLNLLFAFVFIAVSIARLTFAPQWILFLPIGMLIVVGLKKQSKHVGI